MRPQTARTVQIISIVAKLVVMLVLMPFVTRGLRPIWVLVFGVTILAQLVILWKHRGR